jgi:transposase
MRFQRTNLVAAQAGGRAIAPMYYDGSTNSAVFEFWFEEKLMPELSPGDIVIMDNAQFHRKGVLRKIASHYRILVLFLPPYSPDYNPIEKMWANMKRWLKKNMRYYDSFEDALEAAIDAYA